MADSGDFSIFVGDLAPDVNDQFLESFFRQFFQSVKGGKVITDPATGRSKGYGFVRFGLESDKDKALSEMNGCYISTRPIRVSPATTKKAMFGDKPPSAPPSFGGGDVDPSNTTLFIGGLNPTVTEEQLRHTFFRFGEIMYTKIPQGKGCGFVQFNDRKAAEYALQEMNGQMIGGQAVRISWGRSSGKTPGPQGVGAPANYAYGQYGYSYDPYGYAAYDPMYAGYAYPGMEAYAGYGYGAMAPGGPGVTGASVAAPGAQQAPVPVLVYDPFQPVNVDKANTAFLHRHLPAYTGSSFFRQHHEQQPQQLQQQ